MATCPTCGSEALAPATCTIERMVDGVTFSIDAPCLRCGSCGEELTTHDVEEGFDLAIAAKLASSGRRTGPALRFIRKAMGMRAAELAALLDVTPETFSRWETGEREPEGRAFALAGLLVDAKRIGRLAAALETVRAIRAPTSFGPAPVKLAS